MGFFSLSEKKQRIGRGVLQKVGTTAAAEVSELAQGAVAFVGICS